MLVSAFYAAQG